MENGRKFDGKGGNMKEIHNISYKLSKVCFCDNTSSDITPLSEINGRKTGQSGRK